MHGLRRSKFPQGGRVPRTHPEGEADKVPARSLARPSLEMPGCLPAARQIKSPMAYIVLPVVLATLTLSDPSPEGGAPKSRTSSLRQATVGVNVEGAVVDRPERCQYFVPAEEEAA